MYINAEEKDFLEENKLQDLLTKYCKFLPIEIVFGKKKEWKDGKYVDTEEDNIINDTNPLWTRKPSELKEEDYQKFYRELYPMAQDPLFHIHLNVDYPFNLTGILYFPKIDNKFEIQKIKFNYTAIRYMFPILSKDRTRIPDFTAWGDRFAGYSVECIPFLFAK